MPVGAKQAGTSNNGCTPNRINSLTLHHVLQNSGVREWPNAASARTVRVGNKAVRIIFGVCESDIAKIFVELPDCGGPRLPCGLVHSFHYSSNSFLCIMARST